MIFLQRDIRGQGGQADIGIGSATCHRKTSIIWYVPLIIYLSPLRMFATLTPFTDEIFPL